VVDGDLTTLEEKKRKCPKGHQAEENGFDQRVIQGITKDFFCKRFWQPAKSELL